MNSHSTTDNFDEMLRRALIEDYENYFSTLPSDDELEHYHQFSPEYIRSMNDFFQKRRHKKRLWRSAAWAAVFCLLSGGFLFAQNEDAMASLSDFLKEIFQTENTLFPTREEEGSVPALDSGHIPVPSFLPDGFEKTEEIHTDYFISFHYQNDNDDRIYMDYTPLSSQISMDNERFDWSLTTVNGHDAYFMTDEDGFEYVLMWRDTKRVYTLGYQGKNSLPDKEIFQRVADSVK